MVTKFVMCVALKPVKAVNLFKKSVTITDNAFFPMDYYFIGAPFACNPYSDQLGRATAALKLSRKRRHSRTDLANVLL